MKGIILTAGFVDESMKPVFGEIATGLVPVNGKPSLFRIIESFLKKNIFEIYIGVGPQSEYIERVTKSYFSQKAQLRFVDCSNSKGPGNSLLMVMNEVGSGRVLVNLADSLVDYEIEDLKQTDTVVYKKVVGQALDKWCAMEIEGKRVVEFHDKEKDHGHSLVAVGLYYFQSIDSLLKINFEQSRLEISDIIKEKMLETDVGAVECENWYDFGHLDYYQSSKKKLLGARFFNSLSFDDLKGTVKKTSENNKKFIEEIRWQLNLPKSLEVFFPRVVDSNIFGNNPYLEMEYYSYQPVAEIWLYSSFEKSYFMAILRKLLKVVDEFRKVNVSLGRECYEEMYEKKTENRINSLTQDSVLGEMIRADSVLINEDCYAGWLNIKEKVYEKCRTLYKEEYNCLIHGDLCFSNILYDSAGGVVRLIDPRGSWGGSIGGDVRYDIAKLRHSVSGRYDFIVNDLFHIEKEGNSLVYRVYSQEHHESVQLAFDTILMERGYDLDEIKLIEGLLFISMLPLHSDNQKRQLAMYCEGIKLLSDVLN